MYNTTEQCNEVLGRSSRKFAAFFVPENETTEYRDIKSIKISAMSTADGQITIGDTSSKSIQIMATVDSLLVEGQKIYVYESVKLDDETYQDIPMGKYTIITLTEKGSITTIEAAGPLSVEAYSPYFSELTFPSDTISVLNEISELIGIQINTDKLTAITIKSKPEGYICREIIGYIAALYGKNAVEERDGSISFKWYEHQDTDIFSDKIDSPEIRKSDFIVSKLQCNVSSDVSYTKGSGTGITISNPFMTEEIMEDVWKKIEGYRYRPAEINVKSGNPCIDQWDSYTYGIYNIICARIEHNYDGGVQNTIRSSGESETEANVNFKGPTTIALERYSAEMVLVNEALVHKLSADEADIKYIKNTQLTTIEADIKNAVIGSMSAEFATVGYLQSNYAKIDLSNLAKTTIGTMLADVGLLTEATIVNGHVTGYLDSVEINANSITTGTLVTDRLVFRGSEKSIVYELNNITGALQAVQSETLNGEILTDRSINVDKIVAKSITSNEIASQTINTEQLNVSEIFGNSAVLNTIISQAIFTNAISSNSVVVGASNTANSALNTANAAKKQIYHSTSAGQGTAGYFLLAQIVIKGTYQNQPISLSVVNRNGIPSTVWITFANANNTDPGLSKFSKSGTAEFYIVKSATSTWNLYVKKAEAYDSLSVTEFEKGSYMNNTDVTWKSSYVTSLPSGYVTAAQTIATAEWCYNNDVSYINGGKIYTGTVTADKINVTALSAITANLGTVTAGIIKSSNYVSGTSGMMIDVTNGAISTKNFKLTSSGAVSIVGTLTTASSGDRTIIDQNGMQIYGSTGYLGRISEINTGSDEALLIGMQPVSKGIVFGCSSSQDAETYGYTLLINKGYSTSYPEDVVINKTLRVLSSIVTSHGRFGSYENTSYAISTNSFICNSWIRTVGSTGWYNQTYGGGWYMSDTTWIRNYNSKQVYLNALLRVDANVQFGSSGNYYVDSSGKATLNYVYSQYFTNKSSGWMYLGTNTTTTLINMRAGSYQLRFNGTELYHCTSSAATANCCNLGSSSYRFATAYVTGLSNSSDRRLKKDINELQDVYLEVLDRMKPVQYHWKNNLDTQLKLGFIAQDVEKAFFDLGIKDIPIIDKSKEGYYGMDYLAIIPILTLAIQKLRKEIRDLKAMRI